MVTLLSRTLLDQRDRGSDYFVGSALTAVDIYWATFAAMLEPLPPEQCPMQDGMRATYTVTNEEHLAAADPILLDHRNRIYREHLKLPLEF